LALPTNVDNLDIIPSGMNLMRLEQFIPTIANGDLLLRRIMKNDPALSKYDHIIFDTAGFMGHIIASIINATGDIIIPNLASAAATRSLIELFSMIEEINETRNDFNEPPVFIRGHFFCRAEKDTTAYRAEERKVEEFFEEIGLGKATHKANLYISKTTAIQESENLEVPFVICESEHKVAHQFNRAFKELFKSTGEV
jgi:cellulose biosynthesis protein BcsQ